MFLVGFTIRIYRDARSPELQIRVFSSALSSVSPLLSISNFEQGRFVCWRQKENRFGIT